MALRAPTCDVPAHQSSCNLHARRHEVHGVEARGLEQTGLDWTMGRLSMDFSYTERETDLSR